MDMILITLVSAILFGLAAGAVAGGVPEEAAYSLLTAGIAATYLCYYVFLMGLLAQTPGQWFFGVMVARPDGDPVLLGRACWFAVLEAVFGWTTLLFAFVLPSKRALQDILSGIRVIRITVRDIAVASV